MSLDLLPEGRFDVSNISAFDVFGSGLLLSTYGPIPAEGLHDRDRSEKESSPTITQEYRFFSPAASKNTMVRREYGVECFKITKNCAQKMAGCSFVLISTIPM